MLPSPPPPPPPAKDVAPFLQSLRRMLEAEPRDVLRWTEDGRAFEIHDLDRMAATVLPKYFKHRKYTSFQRQLNYFGFRKWTKSKAVVCTFSNEFFTRDQPELAWRITRKKAAPGGPQGHHLAGPGPLRAPSAVGPPHRPHPYAIGPRRPLMRPHAKRHETLTASPTAALRTAPTCHQGGLFAPPPFWKRAPSVPSSSLGPPAGHEVDYRQPRRFYPAAAYSPLTISAGPQQQPQGTGPDPAGAPEPLDWMIDCLLPSTDRVDDGSYGCYMYGAGGPTTGGVAAAPGGPSDPSVKLEYVVM